MKLFHDAHASDVLYLSWWDLLRLACGARLRTSALIVRVKLRPTAYAPTYLQRYHGNV